MRPREREEPTSHATAAAPVLDTLATCVRELSTIKETLAEMRQLLLQQTVQKEWYTTTELAEAMQVSVYTVTERWCNAGRIECEKDPDTGKWRIPGEEYRRLLRGGALRQRAR